MKIEGGCHCGFVTYEAEVDPNDVLVCHCTDCQSLSGSAFRTVVFASEDSFVLRSGRPKVYVKTTAASGAPREQTFCPECGSPIYSAPVGGTSRRLGIRLGTVKQRNQLPPKAQYFSHSAQAWLGGLVDLPKR
jgi:hypothetical protein